MADNAIVIRGAREHNLKNVNLEIPRDKFVVISGISGSGKSSLAFDTLFAEGQRRYVESLSAYARQFLGQLEKPDVDQIEGLSPAISIDQKATSHNPRSTVGTVTEIHDYLRLLYARIGKPHCYNCGRPVTRQTVQEMVDAVLAWPEGTRFLVLAPVIVHRKGEHRGVVEDARRAGFVRVRVNGAVHEIGEFPELDRQKWHDIDVVVDRLIVRSDVGTRLADSLETALKLANGVVTLQIVDGAAHVMSETLACTHCSLSLPELEPRSFSFNTPHGACPECDGLGAKLELDPDLIIPNKGLSVGQGAIVPWAKAQARDSVNRQVVEALARQYRFSTDTPVQSLSSTAVDVLLYGTRGKPVTVAYINAAGRRRSYEFEFEGVIPNLRRRYQQTDSDFIRAEIERYMTRRPCPACKGARLRRESLAVTVGGKSIHEASAITVQNAVRFFRELALSARDASIAAQVLKEIRARLGFLEAVGLEYLTLDRSAETLSGGEAQRIRLATQIGSSLVGVLYILDEPSIGLHQRDNQRLIRTLMRLRDLGNTVLVVEHDEETIRAADWIVDVGPGAGEHGGQIVAAGTVADVERCEASLTGAFLAGRESVPVPRSRRPGNGAGVIVQGARANNLKNITVRFPLGTFTCITGVSGSGKSSLIDETLYRALAQRIYGSREPAGPHARILGLEHLDKVVEIDQSPIGRTPRSNPATYTGAFTPIRDLFAAVPEARARGYKAGRFSFNVKGGRCEACEGQGLNQIEMQFLPDVYVTCEVCHGRRYNREALDVRYKGKNIADVLDMTVAEAAQFFGNIPAIARKLHTLVDVGLGYIRLGQPATTLSGGEAQRIKLGSELAKRATGRTIYILDEPTTGLHFADTRRLIEVLQRLVDAGNTVIVIEHNLDVVKNADWIIDLGPEGGDGGGEVVAEGTPEAIAQDRASYTGQFLKRVLAGRHLGVRNGSGNGRGNGESAQPARMAARRQATAPA
ncbi:MAG: excinuclease ABC subunit UvrA [Actinobacteria bacterium]|nr:excinuclease ABC subunit UvrA [Actinomycetota bacterium]